MTRSIYVTSEDEDASEDEDERKGITNPNKRLAVSGYI